MKEDETEKGGLYVTGGCLQSLLLSGAPQSAYVDSY